MVSKFLLAYQFVVESDDDRTSLYPITQIEARVMPPQESCRRATPFGLSNAAKPAYADRFRIVRKTPENECPE